ncbi:uncharacterized protein SPAPADRAFT_51145 [Spathaspora passalidarum NRRL Y-27907]|uniref:Transcription elongation factor Eaf N-terminal domain-containing protein n=1 Tax=Spathaspora passalidarum (strain NRRL Y-27907 / 11-Y1) TaxID=619300 RepID=G3ANY1_SPAPN|nr:uncharacterized protein SPAPADRAFT_51145 [Spathaspora passalidarum NRRL Y-27907]EGW32607.1 hypothetical protein SPAPADRAFT_51145 [Spathaspora passalidarum NRRL Y-27907]
MSLADGEYEIDLSALLDLPPISDDNNNVAIRYGFIPDSMDQTKPIKLYQNKDECILETTDGDNKPILFEGVPQRHKSGTANDSYYLSYIPERPNAVELKKLGTTIRFNKSRNVSKLSTKISQWEKQASLRENSPPKTSPRKATSPKKGNVLPPKPLTPRTASKRPPSASTTPNRKLDHDNDEPIISESDFDDLDESDGDGFPVITIEDTQPAQEKQPVKPPAPPAPTVQPVVQKKQPAPKRAIKKDVKKPPEPNKSEATKVEPDKSIDLDDDFKDLEDQLQEVLEQEEPQSEPPIDVDSDESDVDDFHFTGIKIDEGASSTNKLNDVFSNRKSGIKPMSLRDLVGGGKDDDLSSSEEE